MARHNDLGKKGEQIAIDFLVNTGAVILERNWRFLRAEIDIIFLDNKTLVLAEVKTRSTSTYGNPEEFISDKKNIIVFRRCRRIFKTKKNGYRNSI
jgi:putative endonuclease